MPRNEYRIVRGDDDGYGLPYRVVWFDRDGNATYEDVGYETIEALVSDYRAMLAALDKPVMDEGEIQEVGGA